MRNSKNKIKKCIVLLIVICSIFLSGCDISESDTISYNVEQATGTIIDSREDVSSMVAGKSTIVMYEYYVTVEAEDGTKTEFESPSLYDTYAQNKGKMTINYYKLTKHVNGHLEETRYQLTDEIPTTYSVASGLLALGFFALLLIPLFFVLKDNFP